MIKESIKTITCKQGNGISYHVMEPNTCSYNKHNMPIFIHDELEDLFPNYPQKHLESKKYKIIVEEI